jgi:hypothetical protein
VPLSVISLDASLPEDSRFVVVSYIAVTDAGQKYLETNHTSLFFPEGGMPKKVGDQ